MDNDMIIAKLTEIEARSKSNTKRLDEHEQKINDISKLTEAVAVMASEQKHMNGKMDKMEQKLDTIAAKPGKKWDTYVETVAKLIIGGVVGYLLVKLGIG